MKTLTRTTLTVGAALMLASANVWASSTVFLLITSPEHPETWTVGALQDSKKLRWDSSRHMVVADVSYSTKYYADIDTPAQSDDNSLAFPNVRLARNGIDLIAFNQRGDSAIIGHLEDGLFGKEIALNKDVELNVHRIHGKIYASLVYNALAQE